MTQAQYKVTGMSCAACSASVQRVVSRLKGVESCEVNLVTEKMTVRFDEGAVGYEEIKKTVEKAGFGLENEAEEAKAREEKPEKKNSALPLVISAVLSAILLYISMGQMLFDNLPVPFLQT